MSFHFSNDGVERDAFEIIRLAAGHNGQRKLVGIGRCENELHVRWRFFQRLEQRVERLRGEHVDFVDDVDLELAAGGRVADRVPQFPNLFNTIIRCPIDLQHVERASLGDFLAVVALVARRDRGPLHAIQRLGENAGRRRLADAARAHEEIGVRQTVLTNGVLQRGGDMLLPHHVVELLWTPFPG